MAETVAIGCMHPLGDLAQLAGLSFGTVAGVTLSIHGDVTAAIVFASKNRLSDVESALGISCAPGEATDAGDFIALPMAPSQWICLSKVPDKSFAGSLSQKIKGLGHVSDQSDSRVGFRVSGSEADTLMSRGCRLDLHPDEVQPGFCAQTVMAQMGVTLHKVSNEPAYDLYVFSGFARSFWHWLEKTGRQFGYGVKII